MGRRPFAWRDVLNQGEQGLAKAVGGLAGGWVGGLASADLVGSETPLRQYFRLRTPSKTIYVEAACSSDINGINVELEMLWSFSQHFKTASSGSSTYIALRSDLRWMPKLKPVDPGKPLVQSSSYRYNQ